MKHENEEFADIEIHLDGNTYSKCTFVRCTLIYSGGELPQFPESRFKQNNWDFRDGAERVLNFLRFMHRSGFAAFFDAIVSDIRNEKRKGPPLGPNRFD